MDSKYTYKNLNAYIEAKNLVKQVYALLEKFPKTENYALCDQLRRAVISVPSNIAEGSGRFSAKEQVHFLEISYGSLMEVSAQLDIAYDLNYINQTELTSLEHQVDVVASLLSGLRSKRLSLTHSSSNSLIQ